MFKSLKEKLHGWTKKFEKKETDTEEEIEKEISDKEKSKEEEKEVEIPVKFDSGKLTYTPDTNKIEKVISEKEKLNKKKEDSKKEKKGFFKKIKGKVSQIKITESEFETYKEELEMLLLENNVAFDVVEEISNQLKEKIVGKEFLKKNIEEQIKSHLKEIISEILIDPFDLIEKIKKEKDKPYIILFCGINGSGKTTTIAKIANHLKNKKITSVMAASDTFRAASIEQLKKHGEKLGINVISNEYGTDPASVGFDAIAHAKRKKIDCVLIDTAGRMHTSKNLMREMEKIVKVCKPHKKIFIGESITGNDVIEQAKSFNESIEIDGIILTKADIDEKGGAALSVGKVTKKPILFLGTGQKYEDIKEFNKKDFLKNLEL